MMVMVHFSLLFKETAEKFYKRLLSSFPRSTEREVNHQFVLPDLEKKRDITI